jgi:hypothetical protein
MSLPACMSRASSQTAGVRAAARDQLRSAERPDHQLPWACRLAGRWGEGRSSKQDKTRTDGHTHG